MAERVLVTGATGFIGYHLVQELSAYGASVSCLVRSTSDTTPLERFKPTFARGDILDKDSLRDPTSASDVVVHLVGAQESFNPQDYYTMNVGGTRNLAEACASHESPPVLVYVSSLSAAGPSPKGTILTERDGPSPISHYGKSKLAAEEVLRGWADELPTTIVRPPIVFGERDRDVYQMFQPIKYGIHPILTPRGSRYSLIHATDLARGLMAVARDGERLDHQHPLDPSGEGLYYIASDVHPSYGELGKLISQALGRGRVQTIRVPSAITWLIACLYELGARFRGRPGIVSFDKARDAFAGSWTCSAEKAFNQLGLKPDKSLEERLRQTAEWYLEHGWL